MRKKKIDGITFEELKLDHNYGKYYVGKAEDYLVVWEIPTAIEVAGLACGKYYGYVYKLNVASFLLVVVEAEKRWEETEVVIEDKKKGKILCKLTVPRECFVEFGDGEEIGATIEELVKNHNWSIAFY